MGKLGRDNQKMLPRKTDRKMRLDFPSEDNQAIINNRIALVGKHIIPLFKFDDKGVPIVNGTGTLINYNGRKSIATAFHVLKKRDDISRDKNGDIYILSGPKMVKLSLEESGFVPDKNFEKQIDVVTLKLIGDIANQFPEDTFYQVKGYFKEISQEGVHVCAMGYPHTANKFDPVNRVFKNRIHIFAGALKSDNDLVKMGFRPRANLGLHFNVKKSMTNGIKNIRAIDPNGISGGPIWVIFCPSNQLLDSLAPVLIGITTTYLSYHKAIIGTHMNVLLMQQDK